MTIRTLEGRIILLNDTTEMIREVDTIDNETIYYIYFVNMNNPAKKILAHETKSEETQWNVFCQAVGLLRARNTSLLDFEAMDKNPNRQNYNTDTIEWKKNNNRKNNIVRRR